MASPTRIDPADDLFAAEALPSGLDYRPDFLGEHDESLLLRELAGLAFAAAPYKAYTARRRIASFGVAYDFDRDRLRTAAVLPEFLTPLAARVARVLDVEQRELAQVLVTEYAPGTPLGWHRDAPVFESIAGVSLASACELQWRRWPPGAREPVLGLQVAPRSLYVMRGEARWGWQHRVPAVKALRYSITFRTLRAPRDLPTRALTTA
jgi:alkylated DNA repair dioxygenase AlkB